MSRIYRISPTDFITSGNTPLTVNSYQIEDSYGLHFVGPGVTPYGEELNQNILSLLETFARPDNGSGEPSPPIDPENVLTGQLWYNTTAERLFVYNGSSWEGISNDVSADPGTYAANNATNEIRIPRNGGTEPDIVLTGVATVGGLQSHLIDGLAHNAEDITFTSTASIPVNDVEDALETVYGQIQSHVADTSAAHAASNISFVPYLTLGNFTPPDPTIQSVLAEFEVEKDVVDSDLTSLSNDILSHINDPVAAHDSDAISFAPPTGMTSTNVRDAIDEIENKIGSGTGDLSSVRVDINNALVPGGAGFSGTAPSKIPFNRVLYNIGTAQFTTIINRYTAAFDQIVMVNFSLATGNGVVGGTAGSGGIGEEDMFNIYLRRNGSTVAQGFRFNSQDNDNFNFVVRIETKVELLAGQWLEFFAWNDISPSATIPINTNSIYTYAEFTVVRIL